MKCMLAAALAMSALMASPALSADYKVQMLNKGADGTAMVFEPALTRLEPGDTITFVPTDKGHNAETEPGMLPEGAESFRTKFSQEATITFTVPGVYGIICRPHRAMGMVAVVVVGDDLSNLEEVKAVKVPNKTKERFDTIFAELDPASAG